MKLKLIINGKTLKKHSSISSKYIMTAICPMCGQKGALKLRTQDSGSRYLQVDHYRRSKGTKNYDHCCFLAMVSPLLSFP